MEHQKQKQQHVSPFSRSTAGKPATEADTLEEEALYKSLSDVSHGAFTVNQVRLTRRIFDRADTDGNGFVDRSELRDFLASTSNSTACRVIQRLLETEKEERWSFQGFVHMTRIRLSTDEQLHLLATEDAYIQSMGIDEQERQAMQAFNAQKQERMKSFHRMQSDSLLQSFTNDTAGGGGGGGGSVRRASDVASGGNRSSSNVPNDVEAYKHEFGLE